MSDKENTITKNSEDELFEHHRYTADPGQHLMRLDKFLVNKSERITRNRIQQAIRNGSVLVNGEPVKPNYKIRPKDVVTLMLPKPPRENHIIPEDIPLDIRYEDDDVLVIFKPPGLVVHPGVGNHSGTLVNALAYHFRDLPVMEGNLSDRPGIVHRIDKDTSGLMVIAKNPAAMSHLAKQFFDHTIGRRYVALVWSEPEEEEGTIIKNIGRHPRYRTLQEVFPADGEEGKHAVTHYKVLRRMYYVSLVECHLETGRTHQIRVHMKSIGCPVFNDKQYGGDKVVKGTIFTKYRRFVENCFDLLPRQGLHAISLGFVHPTTGEEMLFETDLPEDMQNVIDRWEVYLGGRTNQK